LCKSKAKYSFGPPWLNLPSTKTPVFFIL
jgi:hypothetical protein